MFKNKKGNFLGNIFIGFIALILIASFTPAIAQLFGVSQASNSLNCPGYVSPYSASLSYNASLATNFLGCTGVGLGPGLWVIGGVIAIVMLLLYGRMVNNQQGGDLGSYGNY